MDRKRFLQNSLVLFAAMLVVNVLNYGYALVLGRWLGPAEYGSYAAFMSLFLLLTVLPLALQQVGARHAAAGSSALTYTRLQALRLGGALGAVLILLSLPLGQLSTLPPLWYVMLGAFLPLYALLGAARGEIQGRQLQGQLGTNMVLEHLSKIGLTLPALLLLPGATAAVAATLVGVGVALAALRKTLGAQGSARPEGGYMLATGSNLLAQALILNADVLLAKALLEPTQAGLYAAVAMIGRIVFYGSWAVGMAVFPMVAQAHAQGRNPTYLLGWAFSSVALISLAFIGVCAVAPEWVVQTLFGPGYIAAAPLVAPYALMTTLYALANVIANHFLAQGYGQLGWWGLGAGLLQLLLMLVWHGSGLELIVAQGVAKGLLLLGFMLIATQHVLHHRRQYVLR
ncbi:lipopolysaccharide biosynthesis protein [Meiothermus cerbereus]|jgi:O-antigen/teichoic acid export membrane protein|uniref:lipopolysaccharide biosynthesis protein n=1 Tax=Meiothermus cerbereus TaxID=65552 RepID=UPI0004894F56|nr:oligosaccharide flippase family protein [Meiothermus cerbereus]